MDQLAEANDQAKGRRLTAAEALDSYGWDVLLEVAEEGGALLSAGPKAVGRLLGSRRETLGLDQKQVANVANVDIRLIESAEAFKRLPIRELERIARAMGLDERIVSWRSEPDTLHHRIGVRLRSIGEDHPRMTAQAVASIAEATWVATTQLRLQAEIGLETPVAGIEPSTNYGSHGYPAFEHGYFLASDARKKLGLGDGPLPIFLRELIEERLNIPVIQTEMGPGIAGVTVEAGDQRAIVANLDGANRRVLVRRSTLSHELGHLLYDPREQLNALRVDDYDDLEGPAYRRIDRVEQRANAFAVEFIAPRAAVSELVEKAAQDRVWAVMNTFGLSFTAAKHHIKNATGQPLSDQDLSPRDDRSLDPKWEAGESYTITYHPLSNVRPSRAGRFSAIVLRACDEHVISRDTAAEMLEVDVVELERAAPTIRGLFPSVFS